MQHVPVATGPDAVLPLRAGKQGCFTYNGWGLLNLCFPVVIGGNDVTCTCTQHLAVQQLDQLFEHKVNWMCFNGQGMLNKVAVHSMVQSTFDKQLSSSKACRASAESAVVLQSIYITVAMSCQTAKHGVMCTFMQ